MNHATRSLSEITKALLAMGVAAEEERSNVAVPIGLDHYLAVGHEGGRFPADLMTNDGSTVVASVTCGDLVAVAALVDAFKAVRLS